LYDTNNEKLNKNMPIFSVEHSDPGSGAFFTPGPGMGKKSGSGMKIPDHFSENL
jgi:hypothetical protein